jgi:hypothetical protein
LPRFAWQMESKDPHLFFNEIQTHTLAAGPPVRFVSFAPSRGHPLPPFVVGNQRGGENQNRDGNEHKFHRISKQLLQKLYGNSGLRDRAGYSGPHWGEGSGRKTVPECGGAQGLANRRGEDVSWSHTRVHR